MGRAKRPQIAGGVYHITSRENLGRTLFQDDDDRSRFVHIFDYVVRRAQWELHAYCVMSTHYHFLLRTPLPNIAWGMAMVNGIYARTTNRRREQQTHVLGRRYFSRVIETEDDYERTVAYIAYNPVRAGICRRPEEWPWSSYPGRALTDEEQARMYELGMLEPDTAAAEPRPASSVPGTPEG